MTSSSADTASAIRAFSAAWRRASSVRRFWHGHRSPPRCGRSQRRSGRWRGACRPCDRDSRKVRRDNPDLPRPGALASTRDHVAPGAVATVDSTGHGPPAKAPPIRARQLWSGQATRRRLRHDGEGCDQRIRSDRAAGRARDAGTAGGDARTRRDQRSGRRQIERLAVQPRQRPRANTRARYRPRATTWSSTASASASPPSAIPPTCRTRNWASTSCWNAPASSLTRKVMSEAYRCGREEGADLGTGQGRRPDRRLWRQPRQADRRSQ